MDKTLIEIPTEILQAAKISPEEAKTELAIRLYQLHKLNEKQAGELAGDPKVVETLVWNNYITGQFEMNDFLSWASHDLKTPLNAVIGFTKVMLKGYDGPVTETQTTDLTTVFNSGQRTLNLISNLVDIARLNIGHTTLTLTDSDIEILIREAAERWQTQNAAKPLATDYQIASPLFKVDPQQLRHIVTHLLNFAAVRITEGTLVLSATDNDEGLNVTVQSIGKKGADKMEMDSAMLGFIASSLIKLHGGKMSEPQETENGLLLTFSLPR
jgi:K+-sensing histidine kinase KdpD